jgi:hypothetical protein
VKGVSIMPVIGWSVGSAVAALLFFCIWWGFHQDGTRVVTTQPMNSSFFNQNQYAVQNTPIQNLPTPKLPTPNAMTGPANQVGSPDVGSPPIQMVTVDSERIGDLERQVSEDLQ